MKRDTWHWRLATVYGTMADNWYRDQTINVCTYVSHVVWGALVVAFIIAVGGVVAWGVGDTLAWLAVRAQGLHANPGVPTILMLTMIVALMLAGVILWGMEIAEKRERQLSAMFQAHFAGIPYEKKRPGVLALWYKGIKEKTCFTFKVEKDAKRIAVPTIYEEK